MKILAWHVHGSWMTAFVHGAHEYVVPVLPDRGPDGRGRAQTWSWPPSVVERAPERIADERVDLVILQRPHERELLEAWTGLRAGIDVPAVYVEHNTPQGRINEMRHPMAEHPEIPVVHVTYFNQLFWDCGDARTYVIEHGIVDPGARYTGELPRCAAVINEANRRARVTGTDLLARFEDVAPIDLFGMDAARLGGIENLSQDRLHDELGRRRVYLHPIRWTSLGLSLIEAMHLAMPVVALATTEVPAAVPPGTGIVSTDVATLVRESRALLHDPDRCVAMGQRARAHARERYGLERFLADWDHLFQELIP